MKKGEIVLGALTIIIPVITAFSVHALSESSAKKQIQQEFSDAFEFVDMEMSYERTIQEIIKKLSVTETENSNLQQTADDITQLKVENENLKAKLSIYQRKEGKETDSISNALETIYLKDLLIYNSQYFNNNNWYPSTAKIWNPIDDLAADGNTYPNAVLMSTEGIGIYNNSTSRFIRIEYLINEEYNFFNTKYLLSYKSKSTNIQAILKIIGDDNYEHPIYLSRYNWRYITSAN